MHNPFQLEQQTHAALAQYYRWYQVYEVPFTKKRIASQKDILSDDVKIVSQMGTSKGKNGLKDRLKVFTGWQNAHHVQNTAVTVSPEGKLLLEADIVYQNIRPDHSQHSYTLHYSTRLELKPTGEVKEFKFEAAYAENRAKSFMHNRLQVSVDFDWKGITPDGKAMVAQTHHTWVLANNPDERFARLQSMQVSLLKPYQLVP